MVRNELVAGGMAPDRADVEALAILQEAKRAVAGTAEAGVGTDT